MYFTVSMATPYAVALRERAVRAYERGDGAYDEVAAVFEVDSRTLQRWVARWRELGTVAPKPRGGGWRSPIDLAVLHAVVRGVPDATVDEFCAEYNSRVARSQRTTESSFRRAMHRAGYVLKKNGRGQARSTDRTSPRNGPRS